MNQELHQVDEPRAGASAGELALGIESAREAALVDERQAQDEPGAVFANVRIVGEEVRRAALVEDDGLFGARDVTGSNPVMWCTVRPPTPKKEPA